MAFTPKFVDLVRNITTVQGSGPVTLGDAVSGFTSLAEAVGAGEQFYYCIQGVDKPQEREVGRGTMQADGKISRQPIDGVATDFTGGAKTIALVAPAEWFSRLEQLSGEAIWTARTRAGLAERPAGHVYLAEEGRSGFFRFDAFDLSAMIAADPMQGLHVAPASDPTGATGAWVREFSGPVDVRWFGAVGDNTTDDGPAFAAAIDCLKARAIGGFGYGKGSGGLRVPAGVYYLGTTTLDLTHALTIEGEGGPGDAGGASSVLRWAADTSGIRVQTHNSVGTSGVRPSVPLDRGDSSVVQGLHLKGAYSGSEGEFHGIQLRGRAMIRDCYISGFQGDGIHIVATAGGGEGSEGNANCFEVRKCWIDFCRNGMLVDGADANAGSVTQVNANYNRQWGIRDSSFLGNCYTGCHAAENGAGPYRTEDPSARNMFIGCYSEGGQPPSSFSPPTLLLGGLHGAGTGDYGGQLGVEFNQALKAVGALEVGTGLAVGADASVGGNLTVDGMALANGNMVVRGTFNATGANSAFGPQTGPGSDCNLFIDNTNYNAFIYFRSWSEGLPQFDGWLRGRRHAGVEINGVAGVALQHNGATIVSIANAALDIAEGSVLKIGGSQVVGARQPAIPDDTSGAPNQTAVNAILSALRDHGLIATQP